MAVEFKYDNESIEYTGHRCAYYKFIKPGDFRDDILKLREKYENDGHVVLHVLSCYNTGIDWFSGKRVKEDEHGFEVIYEESE
jgi:hypothetical protein